MIVFLISVSFWQIKKINRIGVPSPWPEVSKIMQDTPFPSADDLIKQAEKGLDSNFSETEEEYTEEISFKEENIKDKIKFEYPLQWNKLTIDLVENAMDMEYINIDILFFAHSKNVSQLISFIVLDLNIQEKEKALEKIEQIYQEQNIEMEIINIIEDNEQEYFFEAFYTDKNNKTTFSKEKMIFLKAKLIFFLFLQTSRRLNY